MIAAITPNARFATQQGNNIVLKAAQCRLDESENLLKVQIPQNQLATRTLTLSAAPGTLGIALLHDDEALSSDQHYGVQAKTITIPSAAFDIFWGSGIKGLGLHVAHGPWSLQTLSQSYAQGNSLHRQTVDYLFKEGGQIRLGDLRAARGVEQVFGEYQGVMATNRAAPLRGDGRAETALTVASPSRVQFFDRQGAAIYSSEILAPGNYQVQGLGASSVPGFLEARLVDSNGVTQSVDLAWTADRRLLSAAQTEWEAVAGFSRRPDQSRSKTPMASGRLNHGLHHAFTAGLYAEQSDRAKRWSVELTSRAIPDLLITAATGRSCQARNCSSSWLVETRHALSRNASLISSLTQTRDVIEGGPLTRTAQMNLSGALSTKLSGSISHAYRRTLGQAVNMLRDRAGDPYADHPWAQAAFHSVQQITSIFGSYRLSPQSSIQFQARRNQLDRQTLWSGLMSFSFLFSAQRTSVTTSLNHRAAAAQQKEDTSLTLAASYSPPSIYGPQISLAHQHQLFTPNAAARPGSPGRSDGFFRYASPHGEASIKTDSISQQLNWSLSSRLWVTPDSITLAPTGEDNIVIHELGLPDIQVQQPGRPPEQADAQGRVISRKVPMWSETRFSLDPKSIPFGVNLSAAHVKIPLAANRAYRVDFRSLWSEARTWQITDAASLDIAQDPQAINARGQSVFLSADGFLDLQSDADLPIRFKQRLGGDLICHKPPQPRDRPVRPPQTVTRLQCRPLHLL